MSACDFEVVVVGGGHAGTEAAAVAARMGARTLLVTQNLATIGAMSCNPSIGGVGKGHLVREVDAMDGIMGVAADAAAIHYKLLNRSKGPAVRGPRVQADRALYRDAVQAVLRAQAGLTLLEDTVESLMLDAFGSVQGVVCRSAGTILTRAMVLTTGTFLRGMIHVGHVQTPAGRLGEAASEGLAAQLLALGLPLGRLKTGTPPRLARASIDWDALPADSGDDVPTFMSFQSTLPRNARLCCRVTRTTAATHAVIRDNLHRSAVYGGGIAGKGPRYCPSIEDKVVRFADRDHHQVFLEPEGLTTDLVYPNGISTSLPADIQAAFIRTMPGLEKAEIRQVGYAVEYDFIDPRCLRPSLELRDMAGLFLAGQVNGTTGYEEAAAQGLVAGMNAARRAAGRDPVILDRANSYTGVMIDDLTTQGVSEPYRMFTSRSEFRLSLRPDNADLRLTAIGQAVGCISSERGAAFELYQHAVTAALARADAAMLTPEQVVRAGVAVKADGVRRSVLDLAQQADEATLTAMFPWLAALPDRVREQIQIGGQYRGYLKRQQGEANQLQLADGVHVPDDLDYAAIGGLSREMQERLHAARPLSFGALSRVPGLTPTAIIAVMQEVRSRVRSHGVSRETPDMHPDNLVSRETLDRLLIYEGLVRQWNRRINLVARGTEAILWQRHFADSLQLLPHLPRDARYGIDLGSGAGFPGLVLAIASGLIFHLVEADLRKAAFLREVAAATRAPVHIHPRRAESLVVPEADVITARAFAPITRILPLATPLLNTGGTILLLKGEKVEIELTEAAAEWHMVIARTPSATDPSGVILRLTEVRRVKS